MNYQKSIERLFEKNQSVKLGLGRMRDLLRVLNNPEKNFKVLHVAGTNGKGSICAFLSSLLSKSGVSYGCFTSPHLQTVRERIVVDKEMISVKNFVSLEQKVHEACEKLADAPSFFERITAIAFLAFSQKNVEYAVLEVGLGGRLDATNVVNPTICCFAKIGIDHAHILGQRIDQIAFEKAGIIKSAIPVFSVEQRPEVKRVLNQAAKTKGTSISFLNEAIQIESQADNFLVYKNSALILPPTQLALFGEHQRQNAAVAVSIIDSLDVLEDLNERRQALGKTCWPARYETVQQEPLVILDGAHNADSFKALNKTLKQDKRLENRPLQVVLSVTDGHDIDSILQEVSQKMPLKPKFYVTEADSQRALPAKLVSEKLRASGVESGRVGQFKSRKKALNKALDEAKTVGGVVLVTGSLYLVGELRSCFVKMPRDSSQPLY